MEKIKFIEKRTLLKPIIHLNQAKKNKENKLLPKYALEKQVNDKKEVFNCDQETNFYSYCIESLVVNNPDLQNCKNIMEFSTCDKTAVIKALKYSTFSGLIHSFETNLKEAEVTRESINYNNLNKSFVVYNRSFFDVEIPENSVLISNPPNLPSVDNKLYMPELHGGIDGICLSKKFFKQNFEHLMILISSYSNPIGLINYAKKYGYKVSQFHITSMPFGYYSQDPKVMSRIQEMKHDNQAFFTETGYLLAGVLFTKNNETIDLSDQLILILTSLKGK